MLPLSQASSFRDALKEWKFTGDVEDHGEAEVDCELCQHPELRYHFEIKNELNDNHLWVGSSCIERFQEIAVYDHEGSVITDEKGRKKELERQLKLKLEDKMLQPLRILWKSYKKGSHRRAAIENAVKHYKRQSSFAPEDLLSIFKSLYAKDIDYDPKRYKVTLRSERSKRFIRGLSKEELKLLLPSFSSSQLKRFDGLPQF